MATLARDSFAGDGGTEITARTPEVSARTSNWEYEVGSANLVVGSGRLRCEATTERIATFAAPTTANYRVDFDVWPASLLAADETGVVGRYIGPNDWYGVRYDRASGQWQLLKKTTAGGLVVLGSYTQALTASQLKSGALVMEGSRIRLETADVGGAHVERVAVTDTALTAAGEVGVRFLPGTAHTATTGLQLEGVRVSARRRADTCWISSGLSKVQVSKEYVLGGPRIPPDPGTRRGVIVGQGNDQPPAASYELVRDLATAGFMAVAPDRWDIPGVGWGNSAAVARVRGGWNYLKANHGVKADKALLVGVAADAHNMLNFAITYPTEVAAIALPIGSINLKWVHDQTVGGNPDIQACYGGTLASFNSYEPQANAWNRLEELEGIPIYCQWSEDDGTAPAEYLIDVTERVKTAKGEGHGSVGHWYGPHGLTYTADVAEFLARHAA